MALRHAFIISHEKAVLRQKIGSLQMLKTRKLALAKPMPLLEKAYQAVPPKHTFALLKDKNVYVVPTLHIGKTP